MFAVTGLGSVVPAPPGAPDDGAEGTDSSVLGVWAVLIEFVPASTAVLEALAANEGYDIPLLHIAHTFVASGAVELSSAVMLYRWQKTRRPPLQLNSMDAGPRGDDRPNAIW